MKPCKAQRAVGLVIALLAIFGPLPALAQIASKPGDAVGTAGGACNSSIMTYGWPDANGNILKCVSNVWQAQGITASAGGSSGQVQYNSSGLLAGDTGLTYSNPNLTIGYGSIYLGTSAATSGALKIGGVNGISYPTTDSTFGGSIAIGPSALSQEPSLASTTFFNIAIGYQTLSSASMTTAAIRNIALGYNAMKNLISGSQNVAIGSYALSDLYGGTLSGGSNTAIGDSALRSVTSGSSNTAIGNGAGVSITTGSENVALGQGAIAVGTGSANTAVGTWALYNATSGGNNIALGRRALDALTTGTGNVYISVAGASHVLTTGNQNVVVGYNVATTTLTSGSNNILLGVDNTTDTYTQQTNNAIGIGQGVKPGTGDIAIGYQALQTNAGDGMGNIAIGSQAMSSASMTTAAIQNTTVGYQALKVNTSGAQNTAFGYQAGAANTSGGDNVAVGWQALQAATGISNVAVGAQAIAGLVTGGQNVVMGFFAARQMRGGSAFNTAIGAYSLGGNAPNNAIGNTTVGTWSGNGIVNASSYNSLFGYVAGLSLTTGNSNVAIGSSVASTTLNTGSNNILIGTNSAVDTPAAGTNNFLNIGNLIYGTSIGTAASPGNVGIGTTNPLSNLQIGTLTGTPTATPTTLSLGGTYSSSAGANPKLKLYDDGTYTIGFGVSSGSLDAISSAFNWYEGSTNVMTINNNGSVGIGAPSPILPLNVIATSSGPDLLLWSRASGGTNTSGIVFSVADNTVPTSTYSYHKAGIFFLGDGSSYARGSLILANNTVADSSVATTSNAVLLINSSGNVGIGTTVPAYLLHVGSASALGTVMELQNSSGACTFAPGTSSLATTCSSDMRLKANIHDADDTLPWLADMRVRDFTVKATGESSTGVIAQEMLVNHPDMVRANSEGFYGVDVPNPWKVIKALQELKTMNDSLKAANDTLQVEAASLKAANDNEAAEISELRSRLDALEAAKR